MVLQHSKLGAMSTTYYYGARAQFRPGSTVNPTGDFALFTPDLDAAIWAAELSPGALEPKVYRVTASEPIEDLGGMVGYNHPGYPANVAANSGRGGRGRLSPGCVSVTRGRLGNRSVVSFPRGTDAQPSSHGSASLRPWEAGTAYCVTC